VCSQNPEKATQKNPRPGPSPRTQKKENQKTVSGQQGKEETGVWVGTTGGRGKAIKIKKRSKKPRNIWGRGGKECGEGSPKTKRSSQGGGKKRTDPSNKNVQAGGKRKKLKIEDKKIEVRKKKRARGKERGDRMGKGGKRGHVRFLSRKNQELTKQGNGLVTGTHKDGEETGDKTNSLDSETGGIPGKVRNRSMNQAKKAKKKGPSSKSRVVRRVGTGKKKGGSGERGGFNQRARNPEGPKF